MGRPWKKGQSGNPGGYPKALTGLRDLARTHTEMALKRLAEIADTGESEQARVAACQALLDRGWGKPQQQVDLTTGGKTLVIEVRWSDLEAPA